MNPSNVLERNGRILQARWPQVWAAMQSAPSPGDMTGSVTPEPTLVVDGRHLTSGYDRVAEAVLQAERIPAASAEAWVYGIGLGDLPRVLLRRPMLEKLGVVVMHLGLLREVCRLTALDDWLADPRVELLDGARSNRIETPYALAPADLKLAADDAAWLRDQLEIDLNVSHSNRRVAEREDTLRRIEENWEALVADGDVSALFDTHAGQTVVVAAAGPTLAQHYGALRACGNRHPLIAVDAALSPLLAAGVLPDVVVAADSSSLLRRFFDVPAEAIAESTLVYMPVVDPEILARWPGRRLAAYAARPIYQALMHRCPHTALYAMGSVVHPAIDLAVRMGARRVVLLGADFCYPNGMSNVSGMAYATPVLPGAASTWVLDGHGRRAATTLALRMYFRDTEAYVAAHPEVEFIVASRDGAAIAGTRYEEAWHV